MYESTQRHACPEGCCLISKDVDMRPPRTLGDRSHNHGSNQPMFQIKEDREQQWGDSCSTTFANVPADETFKL